MVISLIRLSVFCFCMASAVQNFAQTSAKGDTSAPAAKNNAASPPDFSKLSESEQRAMLNFFESKGVSLTNMLDQAWAQLPEADQKEVASYSDFLMIDDDNKPVTTVKYQTEEVDFGILTSGEAKKQTITFQNTGSQPYVITEVAVSCPCVEVKYSNIPVMPGGTGKIDVILSSAGYEATNFTVNISLRDNSWPNRRTIIKNLAVVQPKNPGRSQL